MATRLSSSATPGRDGPGPGRCRCAARAPPVGDRRGAGTRWRQRSRRRSRRAPPPARDPAPGAVHRWPRRRSPESSAVGGPTDEALEPDSVDPGRVHGQHVPGIPSDQEVPHHRPGPGERNAGATRRSGRYGWPTAVGRPPRSPRRSGRWTGPRRRAWSTGPGWPVDGALRVPPDARRAPPRRAPATGSPIVPPGALRRPGAGLTALPAMSSITLHPPPDTSGPTPVCTTSCNSLTTGTRHQWQPKESQRTGEAGRREARIDDCEVAMRRVATSLRNERPESDEGTVVVLLDERPWGFHAIDGLPDLEAAAPYRQSHRDPPRSPPAVRRVGGRRLRRDDHRGAGQDPTARPGRRGGARRPMDERRTTGTEPVRARSVRRHDGPA